MRLYLRQLALEFRAGSTKIDFADFNYFHGKIGTGKSSIARLVDYCLGGDLVNTPALQEHFATATLKLMVENHEVTLIRGNRARDIKASWEEGKRPRTQMVKARPRAGEMCLSDLIFDLARESPPRVKGGSIEGEGVITLRDLLRFCYLDQDSMDNDFFGLEREGRTRDIMRLLLGWRSDEVLKLEGDLDEAKRTYQRLKEKARALQEALAEEKLPSTEEIKAQRQQIKAAVDHTETAISAVQTKNDDKRPHAIGALQERARGLAEKLGGLASELSEIEDNIKRDERHFNTLIALRSRKQRAETAKEILTGIAFSECPSCMLTLPHRGKDECPVCGQNPSVAPEATVVDTSDIDADIESRLEELKERIALQNTELAYGRRLKEELEAEKHQMDVDLNRAFADYDSAYLSQAVELEREKARLVQRLQDLNEPERLARRADDTARLAIEYLGKGNTIEAQLREARQRAQEKRARLERLEELFMDCLSQARLPGLAGSNRVELGQDFVPKVYADESTDIFATFENMGGGKKVFFKCCFALAVHRLAAETRAVLPGLLILDSPMKSISERENQEQFGGFHDLLYTLAQGELKETQIIIIDKEMVPPPANSGIRFQARYLTTDDPEHEPLVPGYRGQ